MKIGKLHAIHKAKSPPSGGTKNFAKYSSVILVELSGIEPLTSSLRIQDTTSDGETPDDTE
jgi:hypothetical protein